MLFDFWMRPIHSTCHTHVCSIIYANSCSPNNKQVKVILTTDGHNFILFIFGTIDGHNLSPLDLDFPNMKQPQSQFTCDRLLEDVYFVLEI